MPERYRATTSGLSLERDDFSSNRHSALALWLSMIFFRKPVPTFRDHALAGVTGRQGDFRMSSPRLKIALAIALSACFAHLGTVATAGENLDVAVCSILPTDVSSTSR